jgi:phosphohistidine phosphatase
VTRRLHLLRHAKSSWDDAALDDHARPLAPRGHKATRRLARWIAEHDVRPELVLCSPATRARETLDGVHEALGSPRTVEDERIYHASSAELLDRLGELADAMAEVMLVGHNPGLADLCLLLARPGPLRDRVAENLPTGALATLVVEMDGWSALAPGTAELRSLVLPRELR